MGELMTEPQERHSLHQSLSTGFEATSPMAESMVLEQPAFRSEDLAQRARLLRCANRKQFDDHTQLPPEEHHWRKQTLSGLSNARRCSPLRSSSQFNLCQLAYA